MEDEIEPIKPLPLSFNPDKEFPGWEKEEF